MTTSDILATTFHWDFEDITALIWANVMATFAWPIMIMYLLFTK